LQKLPKGHAKGIERASAQYVPAGQMISALMPVALQYEPGGHGAGADIPLDMQTVPTGQTVGEELPAGQYFPG
jgi:hypothetical protein